MTAMTSRTFLTSAASMSRLTAIVTRQRSSRGRDLLFAAAIAIGVLLSLGALHQAVAHAAASVHLATVA